MLPFCGARQLLLLLLWCFCSAANAQSITGTTSGGLMYSGDSGLFTIIGYTGNSGTGDLIIPGTIDGAGPVTAIGSDAFTNCMGLTSVTISDGVTSIGDSAFASCRNLAKVTIPISVSRIGYRAFSSCNSLTSVTISSGVTTIGDFAFRDCVGLTSITIPGSVTSIGNYAFNSCGLTSITIPGSVTSMGNYAFNSCGSLTTVVISSGIAYIGDNNFSDCPSLTSVTIPDTVTSIGDSAFVRCSSLTSVTIPESVRTIGENAFSQCSLTSVAIPSSVTSIGLLAFDCGSMTSMTVDASNANYCSDDGVLFDKNKTAIIQFPRSRSKTAYIIPGTVKSIADEAFAGSSLTSVTIPEGVSAIGVHAFADCSNLVSVTIPSSVTSIGAMAFAYCDHLNRVTIPSSVSTIGDAAFFSCDGLSFAFYMGNAPATGSQVFDFVASDFSVYFLNGSTGFALPTWHGYPAAIMGPMGEGFVQAFITPAAAVKAGGRWQVDGGEWHKSGEIVANLSAGTHTVAFKAVRGRMAPITQLFTANANQMTSVTGNYRPSPGETLAGMLTDGGGLVKLALTNTGCFSGTLILRGKSYRLNGSFDARGDYLRVFGNPPIRVALHIDPSQLGGDSEDLLVTGSIGGEAFVAYHAPYDKDNAAGMAGKYTIFLPPTSDAPQSPQGTGYARMTVSAAGNVTISGKLADNSGFSASGPIVGGMNGQQLFIYIPTLYSGKGLLVGALTFETLVGSDCHGVLQWFKPRQEKGDYFKAGFTTVLNLAGARYREPTFGRWALTDATGTLRLSQGGLNNPIIETVMVHPLSAVVVQGANLEKLKLTLNLQNGLFRGSFIHPSTNKMLHFGGVVVQNRVNYQDGGYILGPGGVFYPALSTPQAGGFFMGPIVSGSGSSGNVSLLPK